MSLPTASQLIFLFDLHFLENIKLCYFVLMSLILTYLMQT